MSITLTHSKLGQDQMFKPLRNKKGFADATMCSDSSRDRFVLGHRVILGAVSPILKRQFWKSPNTEEPVVIRSIKHHVLEQIVDFIYSGKIEISEDNFDDFSNACRMIHLKLGGRCDKIIYDEDDDDDDTTIEDKPPEIIEAPQVIKKELISEDSPLLSSLAGLKRKRKLKLPKIPKLVNSFEMLNQSVITHIEQQNLQQEPSNNLPIANATATDQEPPKGLASNNQETHDQEMLNSNQETLDIKPTMKNLPPMPHIEQATQPSANEPKIKRINMTPEKLDKAANSKGVDISKGLSPDALKKGPRGYYWIVVEKVDSDKKLDLVKDACRRLGDPGEDFLKFPSHLDAAYVAFKEEKGAMKSLKSLKFCGFPCSYPTTNLPPDFTVPDQISPSIGIDTSLPPPPPALLHPPPSALLSPPSVPTLSQPPPPLAGGETFRGFPQPPPTGWVGFQQETGEFHKRLPSGHERGIGRSVQSAGMGEDGQERGRFSGWDHSLGRQLPTFGVEEEASQQWQGYGRKRKFNYRDEQEVHTNSTANCEPDTSTNVK